MLLHGFCETKLNTENEEKQILLLKVGRSFCVLVSCSYAEAFEAALFRFRMRTLLLIIEATV
jgi:hypothetical protein